MELYIIGNGFDMGHGLPTTYWDFRNFLAEKDEYLVQTFEEKYDVYMGCEDQIRRDLLWNDLESNLANIDEDGKIEEVVNLDMGLETGDIDIKDTLYDHYLQYYDFFHSITEYMHEWVASIDISETKPRTSLFNKNNIVFLTFNFTDVLEKVYEIDEDMIIHIHGSITGSDEPVIGHGNIQRMENILEEYNKASEMWNDKLSSICSVLYGYYKDTFKNINNYIMRLDNIDFMNIDAISIIGHSLGGVDIPYFRKINDLNRNKAQWRVYYYDDSKKEQMYNTLIYCGVDEKKIEMVKSYEFYDLAVIDYKMSFEEILSIEPAK